MRRSFQLGLIGMVTGVAADGGYAQLTDQTPVTVANGIVRLAEGLIKGVGIAATSAGANVLASNSIKIGVWSFIVCTIAIMGASFLVKHEF